MLNSKGSILEFIISKVRELVIQVQSAAVKAVCYLLWWGCSAVCYQLSVIFCDEAVHPWLFWPSFALHFSSEMFLLICEWLLSAYNWVFILGTYAICGRIISEKGVLVFYSLFSSTPNPCPLDASSTLPNAKWNDSPPLPSVLPDVCSFEVPLA